ncbi:peptidase family M13 protein [Cardiosporidium cionae]|uniref:Peptidase family M13 protein n=1 Tax=Cardiosporidium cionae TaxID=476202 RepID=A0ABQ7J8P1_9APIC|nr:peptidase family M13 protein [Cardiosporidium cionae]|eukprot:KAF8820338.1 peptidase family M13 protein [Cardiosporidium cionae]
MELPRDTHRREDSTAVFLRSAGPFSARESNVQSAPFDGIHNHEILSEHRGAAVDSLELEAPNKSARMPLFGNGKGKSYGRRLSPSVLSLVVFGVLILLLAGGGLIYLALNQGSCVTPNLNRGKNGFSTYGGNLGKDIPCMSAYCAGLAGRRLSNMSPKGNSCNKWYPYACGGFIANNDIPAGAYSLSAFSVAAEQVNRDIMDTYKNETTVNTYVDLEDALYHACLDKEGRLSSGERELKEYINSVTNMLNLSAQEIKNLNLSTQGKAAFLGSLQNLGINLFIQVEYSIDFSKVNPPFVLAFRSFFGAFDPTISALSTFDTIFGINSSDIYARLSNLTKTYDLLNSTVFNSELQSVSNLPGFASFKNASSPLKNSNVTESTLVFASASYFQAVLDTDLAVLIDAARIAVIKAFAFTLSDDHQMSVFGRVKFANDPASCTKNIQPLTEVRYFHRAVDTERVENVHELVLDLKDAFREKIKKYTWMDNSTRSNALDKINGLTPRVGYPKWMNSTASITKQFLDQLGPLVAYQNASFAERVGVLGANVIRYSFSKVGKTKLQVDEWSFPIYEVNAYYDPVYNEIVVPYAIMTYPFVEPLKGGSEIEKAISSAFMIAGIGSVLGHELTHGFDNNGAKWAANGTFTPWMSNHSKKTFDAAVSCIEKQYSTYNVTVEELNHGYYDNIVIPLNGTLEAGENIADNGGVALAYSVLKKRISKPMLNFSALSGFSLNLRELFFVAYGQNFCSLYDPRMLLGLLHDPHAPGKWRSEGPLRNNVDFAETFQCKDNSVMSPKKRCVVW